MESIYISSFSSHSQIQILKEATLRDHAGWSMDSKMPSVYLHYFGTESCNSILETYGIITKETSQASQLLSKQCPNCREPNKADSRFCAGCKLVLTYDAYNETLEKEQKRESELKDLKEKLQTVQAEQNQKFNQLMVLIQKNPKLANIKPEVLTSKKYSH